MRRREWIGAALAALGALGATAAAAAPEERVVRLLGQAEGKLGAAPARFVLDLRLTPGDAPFQSEVEGWFAAAPPGMGGGEMEGSCTEDRCAGSVDLDSGELALTFDLAGAGGKFKLDSAYGEDSAGEGTVRYSAITGPLPDIGELAAPNAISAKALSEALTWNGAGVEADEDQAWPDDDQHEAMQQWQATNGLPDHGLILVSELQTVLEKAEAAKAEAGWTPLSGAEGWVGGYPAKVLSRASQAGPERRFESADGKARLVFAVDPSLDDAAFDAFWAKVKADAEAASEAVSYTRVNDDIEISYGGGGVKTVAEYHNRERGMARMVFTYPEDQADTYLVYEDLLTHAFAVTEALGDPP